MKEGNYLQPTAGLATQVAVRLEGNGVEPGQLVAVDDNFGVRITELPKVGAA